MVKKKKKIRLPVQETQVQSLGQEEALEEEMAPTPVFLPGESHGQRSQAGYSPWSHKESDLTGQLSTNAPSYTSHRRFSKTLWIYIVKPDLSHELFVHVANYPRNLPPEVLEPQTVGSGDVPWSLSSRSYEMHKLSRLPSRAASASLSQTGRQTLSIFSSALPMEKAKKGTSR